MVWRKKINLRKCSLCVHQTPMFIITGNKVLRHYSHNLGGHKAKHHSTAEFLRIIRKVVHFKIHQIKVLTIWLPKCKIYLLKKLNVLVWLVRVSCRQRCGNVRSVWHSLPKIRTYSTSQCDQDLWIVKFTEQFL